MARSTCFHNASNHFRFSITSFRELNCERPTLYKTIIDFFLLRCFTGEGLFDAINDAIMQPLVRLWLCKWLAKSKSELNYSTSNGSLSQKVS
jgi:hypothetical protein